MTLVKLTRKNYLLWACFCGDFVYGVDQHLTFNKATATDPRANLWKQDDAQIMLFIITSIEPSISFTLLYLKTTKAFWSVYNKCIFALRILHEYMNYVSNTLI